MNSRPDTTSQTGGGFEDQPFADQPNGFGISADIVRAVAEAIEEGRFEEARNFVLPLHYSDAADLLQKLEEEPRRNLVDLLRPEFEAEILVELDETVRDQVIAQLGFADLATAVGELDSDDAVWLVDQLEEGEQQRVLAALPEDRRTLILQGLSYTDHSAGRLMQRELVAAPDYWNVGEAIEFLRGHSRLPQEFYDLFIVDPRHRPVGSVGLSSLIRAQPSTRLRDLVKADSPHVGVDTPQEEVAFLFRRHALVSAPVVDAVGRLVGVITVDDVVDVIDEEAADTMLHLAGVQDTDLTRDVIATTRSRATWLLVNLATAILASAVIGLFQATIQRVVALAILFPIVNSMGGNAGTQTVAVAVRALATKELNWNNALRVVGKEVLVGLVNGLLFALLVGTIAFMWFGDPVLGLVIAAAMVINLTVAGLAGSLIPLALERIRVDPAVASSVFLTTFTDVAGFLAFLALAAAFL